MFVFSVKSEHSGQSVCNLYGAEHLLRLFVKLPYMNAREFLANPEKSEMASLQVKGMSSCKISTQSATQVLSLETFSLEVLQLVVRLGAFNRTRRAWPALAILLPSKSIKHDTI
jgi:hypothetical protein